VGDPCSRAPPRVEVVFDVRARLGFGPGQRDPQPPSPCQSVAAPRARGADVGRGGDRSRTHHDDCSTRFDHRGDLQGDGGPPSPGAHHHDHRQAQAEAGTEAHDDDHAAAVGEHGSVTSTSSSEDPHYGKASWYEDAPPGTCAHKTLPKGTVVTVTDLDTGATVQCTVADRGPYVA